MAALLTHAEVGADNALEVAEAFQQVSKDG